MDNKTINIALVLYTSGLEYDDRIRKEILSVRRLYPNINFEIFAIVSQNKAEKGITAYGVPYTIPYLKSRDKYKSSTHTLLKAFDFYRTVCSEIKHFDYVWCADVESFLFALLCRKPVLWDLHELPQLFMRNGGMKALFKFIVWKTKVVMHANGARLDYLEQNGLISNKSKHLSLRNYPSFGETCCEREDEGVLRFTDWLSGRPCIYLQSINSTARADLEVITSVMRVPNLCGVVVGGFRDELKQQLLSEYGDELQKRFYFTGMVPQALTPLYTSKCCMSLIFYKNTSPNNYYCEANRFYQSICSGIPVVVGNNPPLKELVDKYEIGIALKSDGSDIDEIEMAIKQIIQQYDFYKTNAGNNKELFSWESQDDILKRAVEMLVS